ncbi:MAG: NADH:ubiquinone oxidoreductase [Sulfobacillus benefaciens]|uniref:NADH:ubiquinone oxidoreductase n=1 Tax=Sulfobacillus benefaciens TaxID=453960 RepID=A0A2T2XGE0_9FIRM|nr:MAG: NADH:ubiquinone oxidoreductase [Sulfobacillus benefaciens]
MYYWHWLRNIGRRSYTTGFPTQKDLTVEKMLHDDDSGIQPGAMPARYIRRAMAIRQLDSGSCQGCESELTLLSGPDYDFTRYGFSFTPSPKHADILVVTGVITEAMAPIIREVYEQMTDPKRVVALGACAISGGLFKTAPGVIGSLSGIIPVTLSIEGCPPSPGDIIRGLLWAVDGHDPCLVQEAT